MCMFVCTQSAKSNVYTHQEAVGPILNLILSNVIEFFHLVQLTTASGALIQDVESAYAAIPLDTLANVIQAVLVVVRDL